MTPLLGYLDLQIRHQLEAAEAVTSTENPCPDVVCGGSPIWHHPMKSERKTVDVIV